MPQVTLCPPAPQDRSLRFDKHQFYKYRARPVDGKNGIAFEDYTRFNIRVHKPSNERRLPTPEWALNDTKMRYLLVRFYENRAGIKCAVPGTLKDRLNHAWQELKSQKMHWHKILSRLQAQTYNLPRSEHEERRRLEIQIENADTCLILLEKGPSLILRMAYLYHRCKQDSVATGLAVGCKPPHVRTTLHRMDKFFKKIEGKPDLPGAATLSELIRPAGKAADLTGKKFGRLTVLGRHVQDDKDGAPRWLCTCICGNTKAVYGGHLTSNSIQSCGCLHAEVNKINGTLHNGRKEARDITGQRFGRLVAVKPSALRTGNHNVLWFCKCGCGREKLVSVACLTNKSGTRSCGCAKVDAMKKALEARVAK